MGRLSVSISVYEGPSFRSGTCNPAGCRRAAQAAEDAADLQVPRGQGLYYRYNAVLKRVLGNKGRPGMTMLQLEAALAWLGRNCLADFLHLLDGDARSAWPARRR
jgi:hypothetical protein